MTYRTPEQQRKWDAEQEAAKQAEIRAVQAEKERKERIETKQWEATHKTAKWAPIWGFAGAVLAAIITGACTLWAAAVGKKVDPGGNFFQNIYQGVQTSYKLADSRYSLDDAVPRKVSVIAASVVPPTPPATLQQRAPIAPMMPAASVDAGTCTGLNEQRWAISAGPVTTLSEANGSKGYSIRLNLKNLTQDVMMIQRTGGELSDDQGHSGGLTDSSINAGNGAPHYCRSRCRASSDVPVPRERQHGNNSIVHRQRAYVD